MSNKDKSSNKLSDKAPDKLKSKEPKLNIKLITNDYEINNLINKINKS